MNHLCWALVTTILLLFYSCTQPTPLSVHRSSITMHHAPSILDISTVYRTTKLNSDNFSDRQRSWKQSVDSAISAHLNKTLVTHILLLIYGCIQTTPFIVYSS